jgi:hypothetical protein
LGILKALGLRRGDTMHKVLDGEYEENRLRGRPSWNLKANVGFKYKA